MGVRFAAKTIGAATESLGIGEELYMHLKPDHGLILLKDFRRNARRRDRHSFDSSNAAAANGRVLRYDFFFANEGCKIFRQQVSLENPR
jgi:hypothetical protein